MSTVVVEFNARRPQDARRAAVERHGAIRASAGKVRRSIAICVSATAAAIVATYVGLLDGGDDGSLAWIGFVILGALASSTALLAAKPARRPPPAGRCSTQARRG